MTTAAPRVSRLFWARAFRLPDNLLIQALLHGPTPNPDAESGTRQDEVALGITPPRVYFYLNQLLPEFGETGVLLHANALQGPVSPFDTGGLLRHIMPVKMWDIVLKREFLLRYTFDLTSLASLLAKYPGEDQLVAYQAQQPPIVSGPHALWGANPAERPEEEGGESSFEVMGRGADIWRGNDPRAWFWEARPEPDHVAWEIVSWSSTRYPAIIEAAATDGVVDEPALRHLVETHRDGGASRLLQEALRE